jgi:superfamily II DNA or RNA helicase
LLELVLTPSGNIILSEVTDSGMACIPEPLEAPIRQALEKGQPEFFLCVATLRDPARLPPMIAFWRKLGERYLSELCHIPESAEILKQALPAPEDDLRELAHSAPPMRGGEYLNVDTLARAWAELDEYARGDAARTRGGIAEWLKARSPLWHRVGRVSFHLAENKRDPQNPFAFLATYAPRLIDGGRVQYQPLGRALEEYASDKKALVRLLAPVHHASERCAWVRALADSGEVFHPQAWTTQEAHRFLRDIPLLEESGLLVRVPDWWSKRTPRVRVGVSIGEMGKARFSADSMLDFRVEMSLDGEPLSEAEWQTILDGNEGLVFLKGKWVEVDRAKLTSVLEHWKKVEREAGGDGVSFIEGMRLLAGAPIGADDAETTDNAAWAEVRAGGWLEERLRVLRDPESIDGELPGSELRATLRPYQQAGVRWLRFLTGLGLGACLADDMGLGKTIQVIATLLIAKRQQKSGQIKPALLVLPTSLLANWKDEVQRFAPSLQCRFVHSSQMKDADFKAAAADPQAWAKGADAVFTTYGMLPRLEWLSQISWSLAVLDEAQTIKNPGALQTRSVKKLKADARIALTGTPVENRLSDLWSIFDFICPGLLGNVKEFRNFAKRLENRASDQFGPLRRLAGPYILRRLKTDKSIISDLPDKLEMQAFCSLTRKQAVLYEQSVRELSDALKQKSGIERRGMILAYIMRFKQLCNHPTQWTGMGEYGAQDSGKFQRLAEICEEIAGRQEKALVFTQFRSMTEPLAAFLGGVFGRPGLVLHGGTTVAGRKKIVDAFQRDEGPPFLVLSLKAGGTGLNLTAASHVLHFDRWWNPAVENQASDRAFRIGQKKNVVVHKFISRGTIEEKIDALILDKTKLAGEILEGGVPASITEMNDKELLNLVRLDVNAVMED